jgi:SAM-dependent methyltransferase
LSEFLFPYLGVTTGLTDAHWTESQCMERLIAEWEAGPRLTPRPINHLPPSALQQTARNAGGKEQPTKLVVAEIGVGGGRVASRVYPHVKQLYATDIAEKMLQQAQAAIARKFAKERQQQQQQEQDGSEQTTDGSASAAVSSSSPSSSSAASSSSPSTPPLPSNLSFHLLTSAPSFPPRLHGQCDFVYCFDVLPHVDLHTIYAYFLSIHSLLKPNPSPAQEAAGAVRPRVFLHVANLLAPLGWERFSRQKKATAGGFYFQSVDIIHRLAEQAGYRIVQQSRWDWKKEANLSAGALSEPLSSQRASNLYYMRDLLFVMERC